jgi:hypothetical protein
VLSLFIVPVLYVVIKTLALGFVKKPLPPDDYSGDGHGTAHLAASAEREDNSRSH